jgi:hypothetical protein
MATSSCSHIISTSLRVGPSCHHHVLTCHHHLTCSRVVIIISSSCYCTLLHPTTVIAKNWVTPPPPPRFVNFNMFINSRGAHLHSTVNVFLLAKITGSRTSTHGRRSRGKLVVTHGHQLTYKCDCVDTNSRVAYIFTSPEGRAFVVDMFMSSLRASHVIMFSHFNFTARESCHHVLTFQLHCARVIFIIMFSHVNINSCAVHIFTRQSMCSCLQR